STFSNMGWNTCSATTTDSNGSFHGDFLPGTGIDLTVIPPSGLGLAPRLIFFDLVGDQVMNITLGSGARYNGRVKDRDGGGLANVEIRLQSVHSNDFEVITHTVADGGFSVLVDPGDYQISVACSSCGASSNVPSFFSASGTVSIPQDTTRDFIVQNRFLSGTVRDPIGRVVPNVQVHAFQQGGIDGLSWVASNQTTTDVNGFYRASFLVGTFELIATPPP